MVDVNTRAAFSPGTCINCRRQKQRCDRVLPTCSRCSARAVRCEYMTQDQQVSLRQLASVSRFATETLVVLRGLCPLELSPTGRRTLLWSVCSSTSRGVGDDGGLTQPSLCHIVNDIFDSAGVHVVEAVDSYFEISHHWLPILDRGLISNLTEKFVSRQDYDPDNDDVFAVMLLCIYLFIASPCQHPNHPVRNTLYRTTKELLAMLQSFAAADAHMALLQSGIILATYETGHGMSKEAYETLISCLGLVRRIGLNETVAKSHNGNQKQTSQRNLELDLCWSAIVLLDKTIALSTVEYDMPQLLDSSQVPQLSLIHRASVDDIYGSDAIRNLLARAQHALRVGDMLQSIDGSTDMKHYEAIEETIYNQISGYISKTQGGRFPLCETVAMSLSALMVLYRKTDYLSSAVSDVKSNMAVTCAYNLIIDTCRVESDLLQRHGWHNSRRPCFLGLCCLLAASVHLHCLCPKGLAPQDMDQLRYTLTGFSSRWKLGDVLLERLGNKDPSAAGVDPS